MELKRRSHELFETVHLIWGAIIGRLNDEERKQYDRLMEDKELLNNGDLLSDPHAIVSELREPEFFDTERAYREFKLHTCKPKRIRRISVVWWAASISIPIGIMFSVLFFKPVESPKVQELGTIQPVASMAWLKLSDGRRISLGHEQDSLLERDGTRLSDVGGILSYKGGEEKTGEVVYHELTVPRGGEYMLRLSDGTRVWLNSESVLKYPLQFSGVMREVYLTGEAYFEVTKNQQKPFRVYTSRGEVNVLGTEFNVRDYKEEESVVTTLVEGRVLYRNKDNYSRMTELSPGLQVIDAAGSKELQLKKVEVIEYMGWKDGLYVFRNLTLEQIMKTVARNYDAEIHWNTEEVKAYRFSGDLKKYEQVDKFLNFIEIGGDVHFTLQGKVIFVGKK